jgi:8-oxo-dGTP diphosphatase
VTREDAQPIARPTVSSGSTSLRLESTVVALAVHHRRLEVLQLPMDRDGRAATQLPSTTLRVVDADGGPGESLQDAAWRVLQSATGDVDVQASMEEIGSYSLPHRDPSGRVIAIAWMALLRPHSAAAIARRAAGARFVPVAPRPALPLDHPQMLDAALAVLRREGSPWKRSFQLTSEHFTMGELRTVHEAIGDKRVDPGGFRRRLRRLQDEGHVMEVEGMRRTATRPAQLYRATHPLHG